MTSFLAMGPIFDAYFQSDFYGKLIFLMLFILSVLSWVVLCYKIWITRTARSFCSEFVQLMERHQGPFLSFNPQQVPKRKEVPNAFADLFTALKTHTLELIKKNQSFSGEEASFLSPSDMGFLEAQLHAKALGHRKKLEDLLFILSTVVSLAPFLGLLGTVWGILTTFGDLQSQTGGQSNTLVLGGLSMALATTVLGLVVAIPALIGHSYLKQCVRDFEGDLEDFSHRLLARVEILYRKVDVN